MRPDSCDNASAFPFTGLDSSNVARLKFTLPYRKKLVMHNKGKGSPYSITERRVPELIPVLGSQSAES